MESTSNTKKLTRASMLLIFAFIIIFIGSRTGGAMFNQFVVGPLVNAVILTAVLITDMKHGILVGILTPVLAAITGQLNAPMVPFMPFIMIGNALLALVFGLIYKKNEKFGQYIGIVLGSVLKALFLTLSAKYLVSAFKINIPEKVMPKLLAAMSAPQLYSALAGGVIALLFYKAYKKYYLKA